MKNCKSILLVVIILATTFNSCQKDDDSGYVKTGTNNNTVQTFSFSTSNWTLSSNHKYWYYDYYLPAGTNLNGGVFLYINVTGSQYAALPLTGSDIEIYYSYDISLEKINISVTSASGTTSVPNPDYASFKVVVIPPKISIANPNVNMSNYKDVKQTFNLKD